MSPPWSSQLGGAVQRDRQRLLVAFVELRARLLDTTATDFPGGQRERAEALAATEDDYVALVAAGAEAVGLAAELEIADREATQREVDAASLVLRQMRELVRAVASRLPADSGPADQA